MIRPDPLGILDILSGALLYFTVSPVPEIVATVHAVFLLVKGVISLVEMPPMTAFIPLFILGGAADLISALILFIGTPPVLAGYKMWIAGALALKGLWTLLSFMS
jgi:hypothetical protein